MARKFDNKVDLFIQWQEAREVASKIRRELRQAEELQKKLTNEILKSMGSSTLATIDGQDAFEIVETSRRGVSVNTVMDVCPELADRLIKTTHSRSIKVL